MSNNATGQIPDYNTNPQVNTLKRKLQPQPSPQYLQQQHLQQQQQQQHQQHQQYQQKQHHQEQQHYYVDPPSKQLKFDSSGTRVPATVKAMFNPNQGQQAQKQPQETYFQGQQFPVQARVPMQMAPQMAPQLTPQQNTQGQPGQQQPQRRIPIPLTEEDRQRYIGSVKSIIERYGQDSPQGKQAQAQLRAMMQYLQQQNRSAQQGQPAQTSDQQGGAQGQQGVAPGQQGGAQGRPAMGHPVSSPAQFQPPANADPQTLHRWRLNLTSRFTQGQQKMKQIREQLQIQSGQMTQLQKAGQTPESPQILQIKQTMNELAKQFKTIESWCIAARNSGQILQNPLQPNRPQAPTGAVTSGAGSGQQQGAAGAVTMQQQSSSMGVDQQGQQGQQQNIGNQQQQAPPPQPPQGQMVPIQHIAAQQQAHQIPQQVPQQVKPIQQHSPPQRPTGTANQSQNPSQHPSPAVTQAPMPQPMQQSPAMSPQLSQQGIQPGQQQIPRQTPVPVQQLPGGAQAVRQSPAPGTPATPTAQQQPQARDASIPPRPGSAQPATPLVQGQAPGVPQQVQPLPPQPGQQQPQQPQRMAGASAQSPPPQQQVAPLPDRNIANRMPIPKTLNIEPKGPVAIQTRPTLSGGANTAGSHVMGTPALVKNPAFEFDEGGMGLLSKRKLEELVKQIDPDEKLDPEVEESVLELVDEFIDTVVTYACKMAKLRGSDTLDIKDMQIILERNWNIRVPGYAADEIRTVRKFVPAQGYVQKMNALAAGKALNQTNLKGGD